MAKFYPERSPNSFYASRLLRRKRVNGLETQLIYCVPHVEVCCLAVVQSKVILQVRQ